MRTKARGVNLKNFLEKRCLFQRFVTSIVAFARLSGKYSGDVLKRAERKQDARHLGKGTVGKRGSCLSPIPARFLHFFLHLFTERLFTTILELGTG